MAPRRLDIDLGPGAGHNGGRILFKNQPPPTSSPPVPPSLTSTSHLAAYVGT